MKRTFVQRILIATIGTISFLAPCLKAQVEEYALTIQTQNCVVTISPVKSNYSIGEEVVLTAKPMTGFCFVAWSGSISGTSNPITIVMDGNKLITATCIPTTVTEENSITEGLVFHALLDEFAGTTAADANNVELTAKLVGGPMWGKHIRYIDVEDCLTLDHSTQAIVVPLDKMSPACGTIVVWLEPSDLSDIKYIVGHVLEKSNHINLYTVEGKLAVGMGSEATLKDDIVNLTNKEPAHLALTWDKTDYAVYVNGQKKAGGEFRGLTQLNKTLDIGNCGDSKNRNQGFIGSIDDIRIYNRALNPEEIKDLFFTHDIRQGKELRFTVQAIDTEGAPVLYEASSLPKGASFDKTTQTATSTPWHDQKGVFKFEFTSPNQPKRVVHVVVHPTKMAEWYEKAREVMSTYEK